MVSVRRYLSCPVRPYEEGMLYTLIAWENGFTISVMSGNTTKIRSEKMRILILNGRKPSNLLKVFVKWLAFS
jgi:hypothetical protein